MSILKKLFLMALMLTSVISVAEPAHTTITHNTTNFIKPSEKVYRFATWSERKLASAQAAKDLQNLNKLRLQLFGENLHANMNYLYNAQPFGVEHGLIKGAGIVVAVVSAYAMYQWYCNTKPYSAK